MAIAHHTVVGISAIKSSLLVSLAKMRVCRLLVKSWSNLIEEFPLSSDCLYTHTHTHQPVLLYFHSLSFLLASITRGMSFS